MAATALLIVGPAQTALAGSSDSAGSAQEAQAGLPFSTADFGWLLVAAVLLLMLVLVIQLAARRWRRRSLRSVARERTDP